MDAHDQPESLPDGPEDEVAVAETSGVTGGDTSAAAGGEGSAADIDTFSDDPTYRAAVVDLLGALAYGELTAFSRLASDA